MIALTAEQIADAAISLKLVTERQLLDVWSQLGSRDVSADEFQQALLRREMLTSYQVSRLVRGERSGYFYGDYKVLYRVGSGSFARVYRAAHTTTNETVALKVLRSRFANTPEATEQFLQEGQVGHSLRHTNIVPIHEVGRSGKSFFLAMEFVEGQSLRDFVKTRGACEPLEALRLIGDVARGLDYASDRGVTHRDLKMNNILVSMRGDAKLVDFGLAAAGKDMTDTALIQSPNPRTIDYAALERTTGVRREDPRSDLFFLGCILYNTLTGTPPLPETKDRIQRLSKTRFYQIMPIERADPTLPTLVTDLVNKAMQLDPKLRHQSPRELLIDLDVAVGRLGEMEERRKKSDQAKQADSPAKKKTSAEAVPEAQRTVMFVESDLELQDLFREQFRKHDYRVLVTNSPQRALARFSKFESPAHCMVFSTAELGESALKGFNSFVQNDVTKSIPAVLLLDKKHHDWDKRPEVSQKALAADHRVVVKMPVRFKEFLEIVDSLIPEELPNLLRR